jgi:hypothetical protein
MRYWATIEFVSGQRAAVVVLTDERGEWAGAHRIDLPRCPLAQLRDSLYDAGYRSASASAHAKGGTLDRFSVKS